VICAALALLLGAAPPLHVAHRRVTSSDGVALALYRYTLEEGAAGPAVLLVPELGMGRAVFDLEGEGLARYFAARGRRVYVAELRGQGAATSPASRLALAAVVRRDLPAVLEASGEREVDLLVHGYAGTLALAAATRELQGRVRRVVALATPVLPEVPSPVALEVLRAGADFRALSADPLGARALELLFTFQGRFKPGRLEALSAHALFPLGAPLAADLLKWMQTGDLPLGDGTTVLTRLASYDRPTLVFCGLADGFANPEFVTPLATVSKAKVTLRTFNRFELAHEDYSHLSLVMGERAAAEVFEPARRFLEEGG
jgi:pimeloyl-ACP methyl ester carboxylesterase